MKKLILLVITIAAVVMTSCAPNATNFFKQVAYTLDYQKAGKGRVFITEANSVSFEYTPIASILVIEESGKSVVKETEVETIGDEVYGKQSMIKVQTKGWREANLYSALTFAVEQCENLGGDGIINLKNRIITDNQTNHSSIEITGMVIKRK